MSSDAFFPYAALAVMVGLLVWQQIFFTSQNQKLVDKIMSGDFKTYHQVASKPVERKVMVPSEPPEDFRALQGINLGI